MGAKVLVSIMVVISIGLIPISYAQCTSGIASVRAAPFTDMSCPELRFSDIPDPYVAIAVSDAVWKGPETCGTKYSIKCTGSASALPVPICPCTGESVNVTIVEHCIQPTYCTVAHDILGNVTFVLSQAAFLKIAYPTLPYPNITIEYERLYY